MQDRRLKDALIEDLSEKMVLLSGPRQCGKTTFCQGLLEARSGRYYNWDIERDRKALRLGQIDETAKLWVFDELHKLRTWKKWLKGVYDQHHGAHPILVTGSARLDIFRKGGDSLQGRYFSHRMHPWTLSEYLQLPFDAERLDFGDLSGSVPRSAAKALQDLLELGGFPEPLFSGSVRTANRWRLGYGARLVREDIRELENVRDLDRLELLYDRLPQTVGSPLSINGLREDLEVAHGSLKHWIEIFERMYGVFRVPPFGAPRIKAVKKESKLYLWDWSRVESPGARLENLVALHLLRLVHWFEDHQGEKLELRYFRDVLGKEVDFVLLRKSKPWVAIEVKQAAQGLDPNMRYFLERVKVPYAFQIHAQGEQDYLAPSIQGSRVRVMPATRFLAHLP